MADVSKESPTTQQLPPKPQTGEFLTGRFQEIPADVSAGIHRPVFAAGAVLWRRGDAGELEYACIHRPFYDDWSLAKGKVDPGESLAVAAVREIAEETGYRVQLGKLLGRVVYPVHNRTKVVYYWASEVLDGEFHPNDEVDEIRWLPRDLALELLTYPADKQVLDKAAKRCLTPTTARLILVRHAKAQSRDTWNDDDHLRPLTKKGERQAQFLAPLVAAYHPDRVVSAPPVRCIDTAASIANHINLDTTVAPEAGDDAWITSLAQCQQWFSDLINTGGTSVVVSQGLLIPDLVAWLSATGTLPMDSFPAKKASVWVLSFADQALTGADYFATPLPIRE
ncbi:MAG: NUDIX domain-containing protein [Corynebacterium sp.]|uniref:NUDIX hydrolase n=1 Tax=Corynebacterium sp. TaxID=1720 RepID=UPI0026DBA5F6|nr:NUDIX domain-containing protein [Corynebacterium sp.]MDO5099283.1 NUDIX domain-containing protein [Corynebacterium sp.]